MQYIFNNFVLDTQLFELKKDSVLVHIEPQVLELIIFLIDNRQRLVSKDEILDCVWSGKVVSESALSSRIKTARKMLDDDGSNQKVIKTLHRKGFRFIAEVKSNAHNATIDHDDKSVEFVERRKTPIQTLVSEQLMHSTKPKIAVLPFLNLSDIYEQEYFSDGITTDIIAQLSKHRWIDVTARNTTFGFKSQTISHQGISQKLNIDYLIEGSVQRSGDRVRIHVSLIDASNSLQKWSARFDRMVTDIFDVQDEITSIIVARLEPEIGFAERNKVLQKRPANLQAWDCYHLGIYHFFKFTGADNIKAQELLLESRAQDERFGEAYAWWAYAVILGMVYWNIKPTNDLLDDALNACNKALDLDGQNATFYALKARVLLARKEYALAILENETAINLNPTFSAAYCGLGDSLAYEGRYEEALTYFDKAILLSPNDPQLWAFYTYGALVQIFSKNFDKALTWCSLARAIPNCQYWASAHTVVALAYLGRNDELKNAKTKLQVECKDFSLSFAREKLFYLKDQEQLDLYIEGLRIAGVT